MEKLQEDQLGGRLDEVDGEFVFVVIEVSMES